VTRVIADIGDRRVGLPFFTQAVLHDPALPPLIRRVHAAFDDVGSRLERDCALTELLTTMTLRHAETRPVPATCRPSAAALDRVRQALEAEPSREHTAEHLAALAGTSRFCLMRGFQRVYGLTPHAYLRQLRLSEARRLLAAGEAPAAVAAAAGFADQAHLTKRFKGAFAVTPGQYRAAVRSRS